LSRWWFIRFIFCTNTVGYARPRRYEKQWVVEVREAVSEVEVGESVDESVGEVREEVAWSR
jgi:hypothetical protein